MSPLADTSFCKCLFLNLSLFEDEITQMADSKFLLGTTFEYVKVTKILKLSSICMNYLILRAR